MKTLKTVLELINRSLEGELSLDELYELWPEELTKDEFYETIYNDVESVVEHYPGKLVTYFKESRDYKALLADKKLINLIIEENPDSGELLELRKKLLD